MKLTELSCAGLIAINACGGADAQPQTPQQETNNTADNVLIIKGDKHECEIKGAVSLPTNEEVSDAQISNRQKKIRMEVIMVCDKLGPDNIPSSNEREWKIVIANYECEKGYELPPLLPLERRKTNNPVGKCKGRVNIKLLPKTEQFGIH